MVLNENILLIQIPSLSVQSLVKKIIPIVIVLSHDLFSIVSLSFDSGLRIDELYLLYLEHQG